MDYLDTREEAAFRAQLRSWLEQVGTKVPSWQATEDNNEAQSRLRTWTKALHDGGYLAITWPREQGGQGLSPVYNVILNQEIGAADCPPYPGEINIFTRVIATHATPEQRKRFLERTFTGDIIWCQGFSEPGAGSDLAAMTTRATRDGDEWVINGQKLWTSYAIYSDWCFLLARTDPDAPKHKGISAFVVDLKSPGVTVRVVNLANGEPEAAEVFWDNVRVPANQMLGNPGEGWRIAMSTFTYERNPAETDVVSKLRLSLRDAERLAADLGRDKDPVIRRRLADIHCRIEGLLNVSLEQLSDRVDAGKDKPGDESSVGKLLWTDAGQALQHVVLDIVGPLAATEQDVMGKYIWSRVLSILGGTSQIQKNILAWRVLGLPRL
jgi:alkylation response protein AidB-like acyl-CoA dehydrogenase